ncbi:MAG: hypothetical protein KF795_16210 [Labilithrix sp.]|nr:hypothetical protein [Labilithrix sp.]
MISRLGTIMVLGLAAAAGCAAASSDDASAEDEVRPAERVIIGRAKPYSPDRTLDAKSELLASSQKARREVAWKALAKILADTRVAEGEAKVDDKRVKLPAFRTWYQKDDFERMFARAYEGHGAAARKARKPLAAAKIDEAFDWNATDRGSWSEEQYFERVKQADTRTEAQGLGGNSRVSYSTGMVRHVMKNWASLSRCARGEVADVPDQEPAKASNFSTCLDDEFPKDAAVVKASWLRADFGLGVPVRPTTPEALKERLSGAKDDGGWGKGTGQDGVVDATPSADAIYTVKMSDGSSFRMPALHLVTKELREWLWISIWWSPEPDTDFGADRPEAIAKLGGPWKNYKMCVVTAYEENDPDPTGGFPTGPGSLGDALAAVHGGVGAPSWCSNQHIERGAKNAQTNCIGCHQHAGTDLRSETVLADPVRFPEAGRTKVRKNFPADYLFAASAPPESLAQTIQTQVAHYDSVDR